MKRTPHLFLRSALGLVFLLLATGGRAQDVPQNVTLNDGWNSVWLEVEPRYKIGDTVLNDPAIGGDDETLAAGDDRIGQPKEPQDVFTDSNIAVVASPKPLAGLAEFFASDPDSGGAIGTFNQSEWQQWNRVDPGGTNNLPQIHGNRPYLVKVQGNPPTPPVTTFNLALTGAVRFYRPSWSPDRYNLIGFGIEGAISFTDFFAPVATTHPVARIYSLASNGNWSVVSAGNNLQDDVAYWIFCNGTSDYMGPVAVDFDHAITGTLHFGGPSDAVPVNPAPNTIELDLEELVFTNRGSATATPALDLITDDPSAGASDFELHVVIPTPSTRAYTKGNQIDSTPGVNVPSALGTSIATTSSAYLTIGAKRNWNSAPLGRTNVYRLTTATPGTRFWLPINALKSAVTQTPDIDPLTPTDTLAGLWVGEVIIGAVTSSVEDGGPTRPAAGSAPIRVILHAAADGVVSLLSQVTIMQTKTADPTVPPVPVLVLDQRNIPFFDGIKERNGKRVGLRIEAVAYDMPRDTSVGAQSESPADPNRDDLIDMIVAESSSPVTKWLGGAGLYLTRNAVTEAAIKDYLLFRSIRPPALEEVYKPSLLLGGALGAGKTVQTTTLDPLTLDPFHRSNPFRHAFHQKHGRGVSISRTMAIVFDAEQLADGRLRGIFTDTISGLTKSNLELTGSITLQRVSAVTSFD